MVIYMKKRILTLLLALMLFAPLVLHVAAPVPAARAYQEIDFSTADTWAHDGIAEAISKGIVPADIQRDFRNTITREEFCRMAVRWVEYALGSNIDTILHAKGLSRTYNAFSDTSDPNILAAYALSITNGEVAPAPGAPGKFNPGGQFTRQQAATMIMNTCRVVGADVRNPRVSDFADRLRADSWAHRGIDFVRANGIMSGVSTSPPMFAPKDVYTRQQAIVTFNNIDPSALPEIDPATLMHGIALGFTPAQVAAAWGAPSSVISDWSIYHNASYSEFSMVLFQNGEVVAIYTMRSGWNVAEMEKQGGYVYEYIDEHDGNRKYAVLYSTERSGYVKFPFSETMILELTNGFRGLHGVAPVTWNSTLATVAYTHCKDMNDRKFFDHICPSGRNPWNRATAAGYRGTGVGENLAMGYTSAVLSVDAWINSKTHRDAMLIARYTELGVGIYGVYAAQLFGTPL